MKILSRYILKEFLSNLGLGLLIFTFILVLDRLFELVDLLIRKGVGLWLTTKMLIFMLPSTLTLTLPMSFLLAALLTYGRLAEHNEITAARASGLRPWSYMAMPVAAAMIAVLFLVPFNGYGAPLSHSHFRTLYLEVLERNPLVRIEEKTFTEIGDYHLYVHRKSRRNNQLKGITIYRMSSMGPPLRIFANRGIASVDVRQGVRLDLQDGRMEQIDPKNPNQWYSTAFENSTLVIPMAKTTSTSDRSLDEMTNAEISSRIQLQKAQKAPYAILDCQRHLRWALSFSPLLFVLLAIPLAVRVHRGGRSVGFALSLGIMALYYVLLMSGTAIGQRGVCPAWLAVWTGDAVMGAVAGGLFWRVFKQ
jgi:lipopolysaccharide export system permease protein